jgi:hypothetical protein
MLAPQAFYEENSCRASMPGRQNGEGDGPLGHVLLIPHGLVKGHLAPSLGRRGGIVTPALSLPILFCPADHGYRRDAGGLTPAPRSDGVIR